MRTDDFAILGVKGNALAEVHPAPNHIACRVRRVILSAFSRPPAFKQTAVGAVEPPGAPVEAEHAVQGRTVVAESDGESAGCWFQTSVQYVLKLRARDWERLTCFRPRL